MDSMGWLDANTPCPGSKRIRETEGQCYRLMQKVSRPQMRLVLAECNGHSGAGQSVMCWLEFDEVSVPSQIRRCRSVTSSRIQGAPAHAILQECNLPNAQVRPLRSLERRAEIQVSTWPAGLGSENLSRVSGRLEPCATAHVAMVPLNTQEAK